MQTSDKGLLFRHLRYPLKYSTVAAELSKWGSSVLCKSSAVEGDKLKYFTPRNEMVY